MNEIVTSRQVVWRQLTAIGAAAYEVGVLQGGRMRLSTGTISSLVGQSDRWSAQNAHGAHIYVRPVGTEVVLIDDLSAAALWQMDHDGVVPAAVVETSPQNFQAWVRVAETPLGRDRITAVARVFCAAYQGDPNAAHHRQFGRLAGFTNPKAMYRSSSGLYPWVRLRSHRGGVTPHAQEWLDRAQALRAAQQTAVPPHPRVPVWVVQDLSTPRGEDPPPDDALLSPLGALYRREVARLLRRYPAADLSKIDWMVTLSLVYAFTTVTAPELAQALREGSPRLAERKQGHIEDYITRTVSKALARGRSTRDGG